MPVGFMRSLVERITPSVLTSLRNNQEEINDMVIENVKQTSQRLVDSSRVISDAVGRRPRRRHWTRVQPGRRPG